MCQVHVVYVSIVLYRCWRLVLGVPRGLLSVSNQLGLEMNEIWPFPSCFTQPFAPTPRAQPSNSRPEQERETLSSSERLTCPISSHATPKRSKRFTIRGEEPVSKDKRANYGQPFKTSRATRPHSLEQQRERPRTKREKKKRKKSTFSQARTRQDTLNHRCTTTRLIQLD